MNKQLESRIHDLLTSKSNASAYSYFCDYDKENRCLIIASNDKDLFRIPLDDKSIREVFTDVYYLITSADIAPKLVKEIEKLQKEVKRLQELIGTTDSDI